MRRFSLFVFVMISCATFAQAQHPAFHYRRPLGDATANGWYAAYLPGGIFDKLRPDLTDLRIYQIKDKDTTEVQYLLRLLTDDVVDEAVELATLNRSTRNGKEYVTFDVRNQPKVNYLELTVDQENFDGHVQIEGSMDQTEWFKIDSLQRILSVKEDGIDFKSMSLSFSTTNYRYLRLTIDSDKPLGMIGAKFWKRTIKPGTYTEAKGTEVKQENKADKTTIVDIALEDSRQISAIAIDVDRNKDFYRPFEISVLHDSTKTPKGYAYFYDPIETGYLTSLNENRFTFSPVTAKKIRLTIHNNDNAPLPRIDVTLSGPRVQLAAQINKDAPAFLYYGNARVEAPSYELIHFADKIPLSPSELTLGAEEDLQPVKPGSSPFLQSKNWLWLVIAVAIGLMGFFTLKMMKTKA